MKSTAKPGTLARTILVWPSAQPDGNLLVYSLETATVIDQLRLELPSGLPRSPNCVRFHPFANLLAESCDSSHIVQIWDLITNSGTNRLVKSFYQRAPVLDLAWHPDGDLLAAACQSGEIYCGIAARPNSPIRSCAATRPRSFLSRLITRAICSFHAARIRLFDCGSPLPGGK